MTQKIIAAVKIGVKQQETKKLVAVSYTFSRGYLLSKLEMKYKRDNYIRFNIAWHSIQLDIVR